MCITSSEGPCEIEDGMDNPQIIPEENIQVPEGSTGSVRPSENDPLTISADEPNKEIVVDLTSDGYPEAPSLGELIPETENVDTFEVYYVPEGSTTPVPLDLDGDGQPDVRFNATSFHKTTLCS